MNRCTKCIMPDTKPSITFDADGVCNACQNIEEVKKTDWVAKWEELEKIADGIKSRIGYNCLVPVSGGKDSTVICLTARKLGLNPLCVFVEPPYITPVGQANINNLTNLGFDVFVFKSRKTILPELFKRTLIEEGSPGRAYEFMLYSVPMQVAINYKIPLVIWGEDPQMDYGNPGASGADDQSNHDALKGQTAAHWLSENITEEDLIPYQHPTQAELKAAGVRVIYLSHYIPFEAQRNAKIAIEHGLTIRPAADVKGTGGYWDFEQLDDEIPILSHLLKYIKFGYGRATDQACRDIRWGYITREVGLRLAAEYDGKCNPDYIKRYCKYIGISESEFWNIANSFKGGTGE
jgi:N-acetyl sugar amidotransferase